MRPFAGRRLDDYLQNTYDQAVVERDFERMVGRMIDIDYPFLLVVTDPDEQVRALLRERDGRAQEQKDKRSRTDAGA